MMTFNKIFTQNSNDKMLRKNPLGLLLKCYLISLLIAAMVTPVVFHAVIYWHQQTHSQVARYLIAKGFSIFFERIRFISLLLFLPIIWKTYRKIFPPQFSTFKFDQFLAYSSTGTILISGIFLLRMLCLRFQIIQNLHWYTLLPKAFLGALTVSVLEEWIFRGFIFQSLLKNFRPIVAIFTSSIIFAYFHFRPNYTPIASESFRIEQGFHCLYEILFLTFLNIAWLKFSILFALGCLLSTAILYSRDLSASIGLHFGIVFSLMILKGYITFFEENKFLGSSHLLDSPLALLILLISSTILFFVRSRLNNFFHKT